MGILNDIKVFAMDNPIKTGASLAVLGGAVATGAYALRKSRKKRVKRKIKNRKMYSKTRTRKGKQKKPYTAGKRKDTSTRRIRYTSNNQPYVIMANGRARFIKKKSVKTMRKRKGGKY